MRARLEVKLQDRGERLAEARVVERQAHGSEPFANLMGRRDVVAEDLRYRALEPRRERLVGVESLQIVGRGPGVPVVGQRAVRQEAGERPLEIVREFGAQADGARGMRGRGHRAGVYSFAAPGSIVQPLVHRRGARRAMM